MVVYIPISCRLCDMVIAGTYSPHIFKNCLRSNLIFTSWPAKEKFSDDRAGGIADSNICLTVRFRRTFFTMRIKQAL
jgi:CDP-diacylglycerol pyrophosphatase